MASLVPNLTYTPNTSAASNAYISAMKSFNDSLMEPVNFLNKLNTDAVTQKEREEEKAIRAEDRAWKVEDRERVAKERQASDLFNQELLKGKQIHGGILNTDDVISESSKYSFTPEELVKYDTYKGDEAAARKAGDIALADKMAWQSKISDFANSGSDKLNESRVQMLERALGNVSSKGLPVPAELVAGMEQARLSEETVNKEARKDVDEKISKLTESLNKDQKWAIGSLGASQYTDEDGVTHNIGGSGGSNASSIKAANTNVGQGDKIKMKAIDDLKLDKDTKLDAIAKFNEVTNILVARGMPYDDASAIVADGMYGKEQNPVLSWIGLGKKGPALNQDAVDLYADNAIKQYKQANAGGAVGSSRTTGPSDKAIAAVDYFNKQADNTQRSLAELYKKKELLEGSPEDRQTAALNRLLQSKGILEAPETPLSEQLVSKTKANSTGNASSFPGDGKTKADRNNNPGNLTGDDKWQGMVGKDGRFVQFQSYELGSRALAKNLMNGAVGKTVEDYMNKYAPNSENDTNAYIKHVTKALGKEPGSVITNADILPLMKVIAKHEGGKVDDAKLEAGYKLATALNGEGFKETAGTVKDLFNKVDTSTKEKDNTTVDVKDSSTILDKVIESKDKDSIFGGIKARTDLKNKGYTDEQISSVLKEASDKERSDKLIADRNYRVALRNGGSYSGKSAEEWNELRSTKNKIGDYGWIAPIAAATGPLVALGGAFTGLPAIKTMGDAKRVQKMVEEAMATTAKAKDSVKKAEDLDKLREAHKYLVESMRRGQFIM